MSVREAVQADVPAILGLLSDCHEASGYADIEFDQAYSEALLSHLMASDDALVLTTGEGVLITVLSPLHFSPALQALELAFWGRGGREMVKAAQEWAKGRGAVRFVAANEINARTQAMNRWYRREGLQPVSMSYARSL